MVQKIHLPDQFNESTASVSLSNAAKTLFTDGLIVDINSFDGVFWQVWCFWTVWPLNSAEAWPALDLGRRRSV